MRKAKVFLLQQTRRVLRALVPLVYRRRKERPARWPHSHPRRVLLAHPGHIGDLVLATATIRALREAFPSAEIGFVTGSWASSVLSGHPEVRHLHQVDHWRFNRTNDGFRAKWMRFRSTRRAALREIRALQYDMFLPLLNSNPDLLNLGWAACIPVRAGFRTSFFHALATHMVLREPSSLMHQTQCQAALLEALGIARKQPYQPRAMLPGYGEAERARVAEMLGRESLPGASYRIIHMGTGAPMREMPDEFWREVACKLSERHLLLFTGRGEHEAAAIQRVSAGLPNCIDACDRLPWSSFVTAVRYAEALYGVESMAGHVAGAVGTPSVLAYHGASGAARWRPMGDATTVLTNHLPCAPCGLHWGCSDMRCKEITARQMLETPLRARDSGYERSSVTGERRVVHKSAHSPAPSTEERIPG